jgi:hypothetical protein
MGLFDFAAHIGKFSDWKAARKHYADMAGLQTLPSIGTATKGPAVDKGAKLAANIAKLQDADKNHESYGRLIHGFCQTKPPITAEGIEKAGGRIVRGCGQMCLRFDGVAKIGDTEPSAVVLLRADGKMFPAFGQLAERKSHTLAGSVNSWVVAGDIETAHTILDCEGLPDLLAAASMLPDGWAVVTNTGGARQVIAAVGQRQTHHRCWRFR